MPDSPDHFEPIRPRRLDHFGIDVRDLAVAERFYTEILGMTAEMRLPDQVLLRFGDTSLALFHHPGMKPCGIDRIEDPLGKPHHAFEVDYPQLQRAARLFLDRGIPHHRLVDWGDHDCLYFLDPDGNILELVGYRKGRPAPEEAVRLVSPPGDGNRP
jgi:catechol 2,3-dioxygenase-like lactoylglutathione lyase family enzyme